MARPATIFVLLTLCAVAACTNGTAPSSPSAASLYDPKALPTGPVGASIAYGHNIIVDTKHLMKSYVRADLTCASCHIGAGTSPRGGSFIGTYGRFPQWNARSKRVIALQDRIAECFLYSMNGKAPAYYSKETIAITAYIAWLSRGIAVGTPASADDRFIEPLPSASPDPARGGTIYAQKCSSCHQANGAGISGTFPPLWGATSFNSGAGMAHIDRMTGFVHYNMPQNAPGSLSLEESYDVSAWVLGHDRPKFQGTAVVTSPPEPAKYF